MNVETFARQNFRIPYSLEFVSRQDTALTSRNQRKLLAGEDASGRVHAALYLMWDSRTAYVHMVGGDPELRSSDAGQLLVWKALEFVSSIGLTEFDFEGSMIESIEAVRRAFGAKQVPYFAISKDNRILPRRVTDRVISKARSVVKRLVK